MRRYQTIYIDVLDNLWIADWSRIVYRRRLRVPPQLCQWRLSLLPCVTCANVCECNVCNTRTACVMWTFELSFWCKRATAADFSQMEMHNKLELLQEYRTNNEAVTVSDSVFCIL